MFRLQAYSGLGWHLVDVLFEWKSGSQLYERLVSGSFGRDVCFECDGDLTVLLSI